MNTMQQEFDAVVLHLFTQRRPAKTENDNCVYRGPNGTSCAVGCRIPDAMYHPDMDGGSEGTAIHSIIERYPSTLPAEIYAYRNMFASLQDLHDNARLEHDGEFDMDGLVYSLKKIAKMYHLNYVEPTIPAKEQA